MAKFSKSKWIGVDGGICATANGAVSAAADVLRLARPDGSRVAMALPMDTVYFERIELEDVSWRTAEKLVYGQLDLKLPVPVEKCHVMAFPVKASKKPLFLAFAVQKEAFEARLSEFKEAYGCDPEAVFPVAYVLWRACCEVTGNTPAPVLLLHASKDKWTLLAIENGVLLSAVPMAAGDVAGTVRNAKILSMRFSVPVKRFLVSGPSATQNLLAELGGVSSGLPCAPEVVTEPESFLASALARTATASKLARDGAGGFRTGEILHPAAFRRIIRSQIVNGLLPLVFSLIVLFLAVKRNAEASARLARADKELTGAACVIAGEKLPQRGRAAVARAKTLFDWRNPVLVAFAAQNSFGAVVPAFTTAADCGITFSSMSFDRENGRFVLTGRAGAQKDLSILQKAVEEAGFVFDAETTSRSDGISFTLTVTSGREAL